MKKFLARGLLPLALLAALAIALPAGATVVRYLSLDDQIALAQLVVRVRGGDARTFRSEKDGRPRTDRKFTILETYKGDLGPGQTVTVRQMRETTGPETLRIPGDPELREGEEAVLFLVRDESGTAFLAALGQSKFEVVRDDSGAWVKRNLDGLAFLVDDAGVMEPVDEAPVPLDLFADTLRTIVKGE
jgi:hypothetical protein